MSTEHAIGVPAGAPSATSRIRELPGAARYFAFSGFWSDRKSIEFLRFECDTALSSTPIESPAIAMLLKGASFTLAIAFASAAVKPAAFTVGTATAAPGQKVFGAIDVPAGIDAATRIDVAIVRGTKPGPVLALV